MLPKTSSGEHCTPSNNVLLVMLGGAGVCLIMSLAVHQMKDYRKINGHISKIYDIFMNKKTFEKRKILTYQDNNINISRNISRKLLVYSRYSRIFTSFLS